MYAPLVKCGGPRGPSSKVEILIQHSTFGMDLKPVGTSNIISLLLLFYYGILILLLGCEIRLWSGYCDSNYGGNRCMGP